MIKCENCRLRTETAKAFDLHWHGEDDCPYARCPIPGIKTNADRIRAMSDEELAWFLTEQTESYLSGAGNFWLNWLKQEVNHG